MEARLHVRPFTPPSPPLSPLGIYNSLYVCCLYCCTYEYATIPPWTPRLNLSPRGGLSLLGQPAAGQGQGASVGEGGLEGFLSGC